MGLNEPHTAHHETALARPARAERPARSAPAASHAQREVRLDIGELVLDGFGPGLDGDLVSASFQAELTRLVERRGVPLAAGDGDRVLDALALAGLPPLPPHASPARIGEALAHAVHAGLSGEGHLPHTRRRPASRTRHAASGRDGRRR